MEDDKLVIDRKDFCARVGDLAIPIDRRSIIDRAVHSEICKTIGSSQKISRFVLDSMGHGYSREAYLEEVKERVLHELVNSADMIGAVVFTETEYEDSIVVSAKLKVVFDE